MLGHVNLAHSKGVSELFPLKHNISVSLFSVTEIVNPGIIYLGAKIAS